jgi:hypothetical protein
LRAEAPGSPGAEVREVSHRLLWEDQAADRDRRAAARGVAVMAVVAEVVGEVVVAAEAVW